MAVLANISVRRLLPVAVALLIAVGSDAAQSFAQSTKQQTPTDDPSKAGASNTGTPKTGNAKVPNAKSGSAKVVEGQRAEYRSQYFYLHTDLSPDEAKELLVRLETMIKLISKYWGRPPSGIIEMYVVKDLKNWPAGSLDPKGRPHIEAGAGVTLSQTLSTSTHFLAKATVHAVADRGTPQHEAVHAYCAQTYGTTGPTWYSEGMAEMGQYWRDGEKSVQCADYVVKYIRASPPKTMNEIVNSDERTGDSWQNYAWRWALCHLLANNPNYAAQFHPLGLGYLTKKNVTFEQVYGSMADQISFEYDFFLKHLEIGYRVDLCSWNWKQKHRHLIGPSAITAKVLAGRGWQPTGAILAKDSEYEFAATGKWQTKGPPDVKAAPGKSSTAKSPSAKSPTGKSPLARVANVMTDGVTADGDTDGTGRLVGIMMKDYKLSEPFELGSFGSFTAAGDGELYLRCADAWNELADNQGTISVKLKLKGAGAPLTKDEK